MRERFETIYTAALADILDARGLHEQTLPPAIRSLEPGTRIAGEAYTVRGRPARNLGEGDYDRAIRKVLAMLGDVPAGHVAVYACEQDVSAHLGELSVTSLKSRGVVGCVLDGGCRDVRFIRDEGFPVFCRFVTPEDSTWRWELEATQAPITIGAVVIEPGDWIVGDDDGVVVVPSAIAEDVLREAEAKAATESEIRRAVRAGTPPLEAYERYGTF
ncbi:MAG: 4-carboxy-4-hydroxy-2-oxoadipate aldolase/oxaloacetate decarboxylase [Gaiellaceae bacterium]|nr:MAG: 4-carboxy-4-hydroxy-2-oxoadipate aldolase/oxaloacetate decarboxylase [Gaiellaceae bacterium]